MALTFKTSQQSYIYKLNRLHYKRSFHPFFGNVFVLEFKAYNKRFFCNIINILQKQYITIGKLQYMRIFGKIALMQSCKMLVLER